MVAASKGHESVVEILLQEGANIEAVDENGCTALMYAAMVDHESIVKLLLANNANINAIATGTFRKTAFIFAEGFRVKNLLNLAANKQRRSTALPDDVFTVLQCVICMNAPTVIALLPCKHRPYCEACFMDPRSSTLDCPICNGPLAGTFI
jgi:ankyrin repeat protein